jgi:hypothetical protein
MATLQKNYFGGMQRNTTNNQDGIKGSNRRIKGSLREPCASQFNDRLKVCHAGHNFMDRVIGKKIIGRMHAKKDVKNKELMD